MLSGMKNVGRKQEEGFLSSESQALHLYGVD